MYNKPVESLPRPRVRERSMGAMRPHSLIVQGANHKGVPYGGTVPDVNVAGMVQTIRDTVTPGFRRVIANGGIVNNAYSLERSTVQPYLASSYRRTFSNGSWEEMTGPVVSWIFGSGASTAIDLTLEDRAHRLATIGVWNNVEPAKSQSLVTALEAHKSWGMILQRARSLARVVDACRRGDLRVLHDLFSGRVRRVPVPRRFALWDDDGRPLLTRRGTSRQVRDSRLALTSDTKYLDNASRLWLEYRFGWTPLVHDIVDSLKAVFADDVRRHRSTMDRRIARSVSSVGYAYNNALATMAGGLHYTGNRESKVEYQVRTYILYRYKSAGSMLERMNDFGLFDVPRAAWELVPFSFLADRIIPIGDWLGALTPKIGVEVLASGFTWQRETVTTTTLTGFPVPTVGGTTFYPAAPLGSQDRYEKLERGRTPYLGTPMYPPLDVRVGVKQMADVAALFKSRR